MQGLNKERKKQANDLMMHFCIKENTKPNKNKGSQHKNKYVVYQWY